jgi:Tol biopolymer transport system component
MDSRGGGEINLTGSGESEGMPVWSPRGDKIAFVRILETDESSRRVIFVMDRDGSNQVKIADFPSSNSYPTWSPQGDRIAFVNYPEQDVERCCICTVGVDGQDKQTLYEEEAMIRDISWSADGKYIAFAHSRREFEPTFQREINRYLGVMLLDVVTGMAIEFDALFDRANMSKIEWSSDGREVVFSASPPPPSRSERLSDGLFFIDSNGNIQRTIRERTEIPFSGRFAWSPDGQEILFGSNGNLYILDLATEGIELFMESAESPDWKDPARFHSVTPQDKVITRWGEIKRPERAGFLNQ